MAKRGRKSLGEAHWQRIIEGWKVSGLTKTEFCRQNNITVSLFYKWLHLLKQSPSIDQDNQGYVTGENKHPAKAEITILNSDFIPVFLSNKKEPERTLSIEAKPVTLELTFASGHRLRVYEAIDWQHLSHFIIPFLKEIDVKR